MILLKGMHPFSAAKDHYDGNIDPQINPEANVNPGLGNNHPNRCNGINCNIVHAKAKLIHVRTRQQAIMSINSTREKISGSKMAENRFAMVGPGLMFSHKGKAIAASGRKRQQLDLLYALYGVEGVTEFHMRQVAVAEQKSECAQCQHEPQQYAEVHFWESHEHDRKRDRGYLDHSINGLCHATSRATPRDHSVWQRLRDTCRHWVCTRLIVAASRSCTRKHCQP